MRPGSDHIHNVLKVPSKYKQKPSLMCRDDDNAGMSYVLHHVGHTVNI